MKKLPLILSIVSIFAVAYLLISDLTGNKKSDGENIASIIEERGILPEGIAFVEVDSLILNFGLYFDLTAEMTSKQQKSETELNTKGRQYESGVRDYEDKVRKGLVTRATAAEMEQALLQQQQELVNLRDQLQYELMEEEQVMNRQVLDYIHKFLDGYAKENNYTYILGKSFGGQVLYGDSSLDITDQVLVKLNEQYAAEKK
ncbi:MAG: OmpH family outer membrane protein [Bacteroidales bacterium]|nr:OmpH family outer membrane protein [Bacteroidales bacterium]